MVAQRNRVMCKLGKGWFAESHPEVDGIKLKINGSS